MPRIGFLVYGFGLLGPEMSLRLLIAGCPVGVDAAPSKAVHIFLCSRTPQFASASTILYLSAVAERASNMSSLASALGSASLVMYTSQSSLPDMTDLKKSSCVSSITSACTRADRRATSSSNPIIVDFDGDSME